MLVVFDSLPVHLSSKQLLEKDGICSQWDASFDAVYEFKLPNHNSVHVIGDHRTGYFGDDDDLGLFNEGR